MTQSDQSYSREFYGYAGAGPLRLTVVDDGAFPIHVGLGDLGGMYTTVREAAQISKAFIDAAQAAVESRGENRS